MKRNRYERGEGYSRPTSGIQESPMSMNNERALAIERQNLMDSRFCDIDCSQDPLLCSEYAWDMFEHHKEIERVSQINPNYMDFQCSYFNPRRRSLLVCSIIDVHHKLSLPPEILHLSINAFDSYLSLTSLDGYARKLKESARRINVMHTMNAFFKTIAVSSLMLVMKHETARHCSINSLLRAFRYEHILTKDDVLCVQMDMLIHQEIQICSPTIFTFLCRYVRAGFADVHVVQISCYIADKCLACYEMLKHYPSLIAATCVYIARKSYMTSVLKTTSISARQQGDVRHLITPQSTENRCTPFFNNPTTTSPYKPSVWSPLGKSINTVIDYISPPKLVLPSPTAYFGHSSGGDSGATTVEISHYPNSNDHNHKNTNTICNQRNINRSPINESKSDACLTNIWSESLNHYTGYSLQEVEDCASHIYFNCFNTGVSTRFVPTTKSNPIYTPTTSNKQNDIRDNANTTRCSSGIKVHSQDNCSDSIITMSNNPFLINTSSYPQPDYENPKSEAQNRHEINQCSYEAVNRKYCTNFAETSMKFGNIELKF